MNYEEDIRIDESALDVEWLEQPSLMLKWGRYTATVRIDYDKAKESLELTRAELDKEIRMSPDAFDIEKITDKVVENTIPMQDAYKTVSMSFIKAKFELEIAQAAMRAMDARKDALENLVRLNGQQYFAGPKMPRDLAWERDEKLKRKNAAIAAKIKPRRII
jgi:hypothetical protein